MVARVLVLLLGLLGGISAGVLGGKWLMDSMTQESTLRALHSSSNPEVQRLLSSAEGMTRASYLLLAALPLGLLGAYLGGSGRGVPAALLLLLAAPGPVVFSLNALAPAACLLLAGLLAFFARRPRSPSEQGVKGCWNALKGWLNIGGVKVRFQEVDPRVPRSGAHVYGQVVLTAKSDRHVSALAYRLLMKRTTGRGQDKKTKETILGETVQDVDLDLKAGQKEALDFALPYSYGRGLKDLGGVLGGVGKLAALATGEKDQFWLIAEADVAGSLFEASARLEVKMVD